MTRGVVTETLDLARARRPWVPLRVAFLHVPRAGGGPGPLAEIVRSRRETALDLLLFAHALAPLTAPGPVAAASSHWADVVGRGARAGNRAMVSRAWTWLEQKRLVRTALRGRTREVDV